MSGKHISNVNCLIKLAIATNRTTVPTTLVSLQGGNDIGISFDSQDVDTSSYGATLATDSAKVSASFSASLSGIVQSDDPAVDNILVPCGGNTEDAKKEVYFELVLGDGRKFTGYGLVMGLQLQSPLRDILKYSFTLKGVGQTQYSPAPAAA